MIVRILGEGQREVPDAEVDRLNELDTVLTTALDSTDSGADDAWRAALVELVGYVRAHGTTLPDDDLRPSDAILPGDDASAEDVRELLAGHGLIPG